MASPAPDPQLQLDQTYREEWGRIVATLIRLFGSFELAEEAAQEAFAIAVEQWPRHGPPQGDRRATPPFPLGRRGRP
jgi:predicted RNA polymerase sigma factor